MKYRKSLSFFMACVLLLSLLPCLGKMVPVHADAAGKYVIDIVWDGLSADLFDSLKASGMETPNIDALISRGTKLDNVKTVIPSYGGAQAAWVTGAYPATNGYLYRYYDPSTNNVYSDTSVTCHVYGQTVFEAVYAQMPGLKTLAAGLSVGALSLDGRGVYKTGDDAHRLIEYEKGDKLVSFGTVCGDILDAIGNAPLGMPDYLPAYSNDIKMLYWNGGASNDAAVRAKAAETVQQLDAKLGEIVGALQEKGIYDDTIIILHSLSGAYAMKTKINGSNMAADITNMTGVSAEYNGGGSVKPGTKAVIVKTYIMKYAQLSFTGSATDEDKQKVLSYLKDKNTAYGQYVKEVLDPANFNAPAAFADYLINPVGSGTFSAASTGCFRTDNLDEMEQFCVVSGAGVIKGAEVPGASIADIAPTVCNLLGVNTPANCEGVRWDIFDLEPPQLDVRLTGQTNPQGKYKGKVTVSVNASDDKGLALLQYDTGSGYMDYSGPFEVNMDCSLRVRAADNAGNTVAEEHVISFVQLLGNLSLSGDYETIHGAYYTDSSSITVNGNVLVDDPNLVVGINGVPVSAAGSAFTGSVELRDGLNEIKVQASLNDIGNSYTIPIYKAYAPKLTSLSDGAVVSEPVAVLEGTVVPGSQVQVNGSQADIDGYGNFTAQVSLAEGENSIRVVSSIGKYVGRTDLKISYYIPARIAFTNLANLQVVHSGTVVVEGTVDRKCTVTFNGEEVSLDSENTFKKSVRLAKGVNLITVATNRNGVISSESIKVVYVPPDDGYVVYINWDGFAQYYFDLAHKGGTSRTPVLDGLIKEGVLFDNAYTGIPAITNAMQPVIVSGAWPATTGNCYRYYDKKQNMVVQFARENNAETIAEAAVRQGLTVASVNQFVLEDRGTAVGDPKKPYIQAGGSTGCSARFDAAIRLIEGDPAGEGASRVQLDEVPRFIALYMDDLDGIGHNEQETYGVPVADTEAKRLENVLVRLELMDKKLGEFIQACKDRGIYDNMSYILTTDHGMAPLGRQGTETDAYTYSKLPSLISKLEGLGYNAKVMFAGERPEEDTDIVIVCVGLEAQLSFTGEWGQEDTDRIIAAIKDEAYAGTIMQKEEMKQRGVVDGFADLIISPKPPYHFKTVTYDKAYVARGQHDSLDETAQKIFSLMWGKGIRKGLAIDSKIYNVDFARTMAKLLSIEGPKDAAGRVLENALLSTVPTFPGNYSNDSGDDSGNAGQTGATTVDSTKKAEKYKVNLAKPVLDAMTKTALVSADADAINRAFEHARTDQQGNRAILAEVPQVEGALSYSISLPVSSLASGEANKKIAIHTHFGNITVPANMLNANEAAGTQEVELAIAKADTSGLDPGLKEQIGNKPVIRLGMKAGGKALAWNNPDAPVTVAIPYVPSPEELADPEHIVVWYIDGAGKVVPVPNGRYDPDSGLVVFEATHFSRYAVAFVKTTFEDLGAHQWAKKPVEIMASKGIIRGVTEGTFAPQEYITRGQFLSMLVKALGLTAKFNANFDDVKPSDEYYDALGIAKKLKVAAGCGDNRFRPADRILRQDMMVLAARALKVADSITAGEQADILSAFSDASSISPYAVQSMAAVVREGLARGSGDRLNPLGYATRAEAAVFIYRIYNKYRY